MAFLRQWMPSTAEGEHERSQSEPVGSMWMTLDQDEREHCSADEADEADLIMDADADADADDDMDMEVDELSSSRPDTPTPSHARSRGWSGSSDAGMPSDEERGPRRIIRTDLMRRFVPVEVLQRSSVTLSPKTVQRRPIASPPLPHGAPHASSAHVHGAPAILNRRMSDASPPHLRPGPASSRPSAGSSANPIAMLESSDEDESGPNSPSKNVTPRRKPILTNTASEVSPARPLEDSDTTPRKRPPPSVPVSAIPSLSTLHAIDARFPSAPYLAAQDSPMRPLMDSPTTPRMRSSLAASGYMHDSSRVTRALDARVMSPTRPNTVASVSAPAPNTADAPAALASSSLSSRSDLAPYAPDVAPDSPMFMPSSARSKPSSSTSHNTALPLFLPDSPTPLSRVSGNLLAARNPPSSVNGSTGATARSPPVTHSVVNRSVIESMLRNSNVTPSSTPRAPVRSTDTSLPSATWPPSTRKPGVTQPTPNKSASASRARAQPVFPTASTSRATGPAPLRAPNPLLRGHARGVSVESSSSSLPDIDEILRKDREETRLAAMKLLNAHDPNDIIDLTADDSSQSADDSDVVVVGIVEGANVIVLSSDDDDHEPQRTPVGKPRSSNSNSSRRSQGAAFVASPTLVPPSPEMAKKSF